MSDLILTLPEEPNPGTVVEIANGQNAGNRYERLPDGSWQQTHLSVTVPVTESRPGVAWSAIWWAVTEDGSGGDAVRIVPPDPYPLPWRATGDRDAWVEAANGRIVCEIEGGSVRDEEKRAAAERIVAAVNRGAR